MIILSRFPRGSDCWCYLIDEYNMYVFAAFDYGQWGLIEPVMTVEVAVPTEYLGGVLAGLSRRQAIIIAQETGQGYAAIRCEVTTIH